LRELHGDPRVLRCDNASYIVSRRATSFRVSKGIRTETICPYESNQAGTAERMNRTLFSGARTVLLASGLDRCWWHHAVMYQTYLQNIKYSSVTCSSPHVLVYGTKPDVSALQEFGVEAWVHRREDQRQDAKFDARGEHVIFVGYPTNQQGYLLWCPGRGPKKVVTSNHVVFGSVCPRSTRSPVELIDHKSTHLPSDQSPSALTIEDLNQAVDLQIVGTFEANLIVMDSAISGLRTMDPSDLPKVLAYTMKRNLSEVHLSLADSAHLVTQPMTDDSFLTGPNDRIPSTITQALSSSFVQEWGPAIDRENEGFRQHACFEAVPLPSGARTLPGI